MSLSDLIRMLENEGPPAARTRLFNIQTNPRVGRMSCWRYVIQNMFDLISDEGGEYGSPSKGGVVFLSSGHIL